MGLPIRMTFEPIREAAPLELGPAYAIVGTPLAHPARILYVSNLTDVGIMFSTDGVTDHFIVPSMGFLLIDVATNQTQTQGCFFPTGMGIFAREIGTATTGNVFITVLYATDLQNV